MATKTKNKFIPPWLKKKEEEPIAPPSKDKKKKKPMHKMPDGSMMPGKTHPKKKAPGVAKKGNGVY